jgi:hypothetical protein
MHESALSAHRLPQEDSMRTLIAAALLGLTLLSGCSSPQTLLSEREAPAEFAAQTARADNGAPQPVERTTVPPRVQN